ncbi:YihY/virulence factor BrkB family protein [uncultured Reyranella sp.]|uniref:YihY/virulence factor BrkB family protein n=1 Tax=uncultured Reyranella sp. TaxID=735512 RepID=UPI0025F1BA20|nr:YihY/virulence factor BrkB family protein [uncultured Reyranella sp.]
MGALSAGARSPPVNSLSSYGRVRRLVTETVEGFIDDGALSRGASIAYFTLFSLAPVLLLVIAVAGLAFGRDAAEGAIVDQLSGLMGRDTAEATQAMIRSAGDRTSGLLATLIGVATVLIAASGVFGEVQSALNAIWKTQSRTSTMSRLLRARLASFGLVITLGFVLMVSLALSAALTALGKFLKYRFPVAEFAVQATDFVTSVGLISGMFAIMYKVLPDTPIRWRDVAVGALMATGLFEGGKYLIALYIGQTDVASSFGAAGALIVLLLWIFYSTLIFLLGAEFTRAWTHVYGSRCDDPAAVPLRAS